MTSPLFFLADAVSGSAPTTWFLGIGVFGLILAGLATLFWIWMLIDALMNPRLDSTMKIVWAAVIFFFPFLGALIYLIVGRAGKPTAPQV